MASSSDLVDVSRALGPAICSPESRYACLFLDLGHRGVEADFFLRTLRENPRSRAAPGSAVPEDAAPIGNMRNQYAESISGSATSEYDH